MALLPTEAAKLSNDVLRLRTPVHHRQSRARPPSSSPHPRRDPATLPPRGRHASDPRRRASRVAGAREAPPLAHPVSLKGELRKGLRRREWSDCDGGVGGGGASACRLSPPFP